MVVADVILSNAIGGTFNSKPQFQPYGGASGKVRGSFVYIIWQPWMYVQNFVAIHPEDIEIFQWMKENVCLLLALNER